MTGAERQRHGQDGKLVYQQIPGWHGKCTPGEEFNASMCNQKLIGAQYFNAGWGGDAGIDAERPWEFNSARDYNGHGTHTSSTAGGNNGVRPPARLPSSAPSAAWRRAPASPCIRRCGPPKTPPRPAAPRSDLVAAIDQAVADGVDVINYSISGTPDQLPRPG